MKKIAFPIKAVIIAISVVLVFVSLIYIGLGFLYKDSFSYGTYINGIYCTGKTVDEVNELLSEQFVYDGLTVKINGSDDIYIDASDCDYYYDFKAALLVYLDGQNSWLWPMNLTEESKERVLKPVAYYDENKLNTICDKYDILTRYIEPKVYIDKSADNYVLFDSVIKRPDCDKIRQTLIDSFGNSENELIIDDSFYYDAEYSEEELAVLDEYASLMNMFSADITYVLGDDTVYLSDSILDSFLLKDDAGDYVYDENGCLQWDDSSIEKWVLDFASSYNTVGATREFVATDGEIINISGGIYGNIIDSKAEYEYLKNALREGIQEEREPEYTQKAMFQGKNDIGDTYIEVDMTDQMLYYYEKGELIIQTSVVTGNMLLGRDTPSGVNYVYFKQKNRTLHGADYTSFVKYWIAVKGAIGIHDASWRDEYGGDIYLTGGSHGCINTPLDEVSKLYDLVEIGTPCVMFYSE